MPDVSKIPRHSTKTALDMVLHGKITQEMIESARQYHDRILPRLQSLCSIDLTTMNDLRLYSFRPDMYSFRTLLKGDYMLTFYVNDIAYLFLVRDNSNVSTSDNYNCISTFVNSGRDYTQNQRSYTILKKEIHNKSSDAWSTIFVSPKLKL